MGNAAFSRMVASLSPDRTVARQTATTDAPTAAEIADAEEWAAEGIRKGTDLTPGNPGAGLNNAPGGFDAEYDPKLGRLTIVMRCGVEFVDGIGRDDKARDGLHDQLDAINALPTEIERRQALAQFRWSLDEDDPEKVQFRSDVETRIEGFWGGQHEFFLRKSGWATRCSRCIRTAAGSTASPRRQVRPRARRGPHGGDPPGAGRDPLGRAARTTLLS